MPAILYEQLDPPFPSMATYTFVPAVKGGEVAWTKLPWPEVQLNGFKNGQSPVKKTDLETAAIVNTSIIT